MSNKPSIYATCKAGCQWETVHKDDFLRSASIAEVPLNGATSYLIEVGKKYQFELVDGVNAYTDILKIKHDFNETLIAFQDEGVDKYKKRHTIEVVAVVPNDDVITLAYDIDGHRETYDVTGANAIREITNGNYSFTLLNVKKLYVCNTDATLTAEPPQIGENGNWYIGDEDTGVSARGIKGETGPQGPQGPQGATGPQGPQGADGVGIKSVVQTTISNADGEANVITVTKTDGTTSTFIVRNGSKGERGTVMLGVRISGKTEDGYDFFATTFFDESLADYDALLAKLSAVVGVYPCNGYIRADSGVLMVVGIYANSDNVSFMAIGSDGEEVYPAINYLTDIATAV
jgi:hypothetical protein